MSRSTKRSAAAAPKPSPVDDCAELLAKVRELTMRMRNPAHLQEVLELLQEEAGHIGGQVVHHCQSPARHPHARVPVVISGLANLCSSEGTGAVLFCTAAACESTLTQGNDSYRVDQLLALVQHQRPLVAEVQARFKPGRVLDLPAALAEVAPLNFSSDVQRASVAALLCTRAGKPELFTVDGPTAAAELFHQRGDPGTSAGGAMLVRLALAVWAGGGSPSALELLHHLDTEALQLVGDLLTLAAKGPAGVDEWLSRGAVAARAGAVSMAGGTS